jgi:hypothetical protein
MSTLQVIAAYSRAWLAALIKLIRRITYQAQAQKKSLLGLKSDQKGKYLIRLHCTLNDAQALLFSHVNFHIHQMHVTTD